MDEFSLIFFTFFYVLTSEYDLKKLQVQHEKIISLIFYFLLFLCHFLYFLKTFSFNFYDILPFRLFPYFLNIFFLKKLINILPI